MTSGDRKTYFLCVATIVAACLAVFGRAIGFGFVAYDDQIHVYENPYLNPPTWANVAHFWTTPYEQLYVPLSYTVFAALCVLAHRPDGTGADALNPAVFHAANVFLHVVCCLLVFQLLRQIVKRDVPALLGSLLFAVHPMQIESVAWISELRGLLASALALGATVIYLRGDRERSISVFRYVAATLLFALSLLAKPSTVVMPAIALLLDWYVNRRPLRQYLLQLGPWFLIAAGFVIVTHGSQPVNASIEIPLIQRPLIVLDSLAFYIEKLLVPWPIGIDYGRTPHRVLASSSVRFEWLLPLALAVGSYLCRKRAPWLPLAAVIMFVGLSPMLGFAPFIFQYISTVADRYVYLAMLGPAIAVAMVFAGGRQPVKWLVAAFAGTCAALSVAHVGVWSNTYALVTSAIAVNPQSSGAHMDLGVIYSDRHLNDKAEAEFATAVRLRPDYSMAHYNLGNAFKDRGAYSQAISEYVTAIKLEPQRAVFYLNLATALYDSGHSQEALPIVDHAKHLDPHLAQVDYLRGNVLMQLGRNEEAISAFQEEITRNPAFAPSYVNAGIVLVAMRRLPDAEAMMRRAVQIGPGSASRYANLAYIQLQLGHVSDARQSLQTALRIDANDQTALAVAAAMRLAH